LCFKERAKKTKQTIKVKVVTNKKTKSKSRGSGLRRRDVRTNVVSAYALARMNPFLAGVNGVRSPDEFGYPTATAVIRTSDTFTTNAGGFHSQAYYHMVNTYRYDPLNTTGGTITWAGGAGQAPPQQTAINTLAAVGRTATWGLRISTITSLTATSGYLWVAHVPFDDSASFPYNELPTTEAGVSQLPLAEKFSLVELAEKPLIVAGRAFDDGIYRFRDTGTDAATSKALESTYGWAAIVLLLVGGPASTATLNVEYVNHFEYMQRASALYGFIDTIPMGYNEVAIEQAAAISAASPVAFIENAVGTIDRAASSANRIMDAAARLAQAGAAVMGMAGRYNTAIRGIHSNRNTPRLKY